MSVADEINGHFGDLTAADDTEDDVVGPAEHGFHAVDAEPVATDDTQV